MRHRLGQRRSDSPLKALPRVLVLALASCFGSAALALPVGPQLVAGNAAITQAGNALTVANSPGAILNWQTFNIGANERVRFEQASASSAVLNRVLANDPSVILGQLSSNGRVWLVNPAGILVGPGARIDTAAFVASTLNITNADFLANKLKLDGLGGAGNVVNQGTITTPMGGSVYLIGSQVSNDGIVTTPNGETILAAGQKVELIDTATPGVKVEITGQEGNVTNLGQITAEAGRIGIAGALIKNAGTLNASSVESAGGRIFLRATKKIELTETSKVGADGTAGGNVTAVVSKNGTISGELTANGEISVQGNGTSGSGGFVETSASHLSIGDGFKVATRGGHWLLDPVDFVIAATGGNITGTALSTLLGSNSITIQTATGTDTATHRYGTTGSNGDIFVNDTVTWLTNKLTLNAHRNIAINTAMNGSGTASLALEYGQGAVAASNTATYTINAPVNLPAGNNFSTKLGSDGTTTIYAVIASLSGLQNISSDLSGSYALGSDISGSVFTSVGNKTTPFNGTFAGLGHKISALSITPNSDYAGLFGATDTTSIIRDVTLDGTVISAGNYIGDLVGFNAGAISNAHTRGSTSRSGTNYIGGLVGFNTGTIDYSSNTSTNPVSAGGKSFVGGLVGANYGDIRNSYNSGSVSAGGATSGGGIAGINAGKISYSYSSGSVVNSGGGKIGGIVGINNGTIEHSYWDTQTSTQTACAGAGSSSGCAGKTTAEMQTQATYSGWDFTTIWAISSGHYPTLSLRQTAPSAQVTTSDVNLWTGGGNDSLWTTASNWSLNHTPTSSENVYVPSSVAFTFGAGNIELKSLICDSNFTLDGRTLSLGSSSTLSAITLNASSARLVLNGVTSIGSLTLSSGEISGTGSLNVTASFSKTGGTIANTLTGLHITQASGNLTPGALTINGPIALVASNGALNLDSLTGTTLSAQAGNGNLTLTSGAHFSATATSGNSIVLNAGSANFVNSSGSTSPFSLAGTARSLVYAGSSTTASLGGLTDKPIYGKTYTSYAPASVTQTGNRILYADTPGSYAVIAENKTRYYGDTNPNLTYGAINILAGDTISGSPLLATDAVLLSNAGTYNITASQGSLVSDYNLPFTFHTGTLTVASRPLTITAGNATRVYGDSNPTVTAFTAQTGTANSGTGLVNGDSVSSVINIIASSATTLANAGTSHGITPSAAQFNTGLAGNYVITYVDGSLTIAQRPLTVSVGGSKVYDRSTVLSAPTFTLGNLANNDNLSVTGFASFADWNVGNNKPITASAIQVSGPKAGNYTWNTTTTGSGAIAVRPLAIAAHAKTMTYGDAVPGLTYTMTTGTLVNGDNLSGALVTAGTTTSDVGNYLITQGNLEAGNNYSIAFTGSTLAITPRMLSFTLGGSKIYDRSTVLSAPAFALGNLANNDNLSVTGFASFADWNVGSGKTLTATGLTLAGEKAGNYQVPTEVTGSGSITQRPTVTWTGAAGDGKWSTPGNWADNAIPDYDLASNLDNVGRIFLTSGNTPLRITDTQAVRLRQTSLDVSGAGLDLDVIGGISTGSGKLLASEGSLKLTAHSPIVIGSGGLEASQGISLLATTPEGASTILINGPLTSTSGPITLSAYNNIILNASLTGTTIQRSSQIGSIQVAAGVTVSEVPAANPLSPGEQVAQVVVTNLATATHAATVTAVENSSTSGSSLNLPLIPSLLLPSLTQTIGGEEGQFGSVASTTDTPAATTEKTAQADANPATNTAHKKVAQCS